ncbi:hypothetical protein [Sphingopyxis sp.]|uniref:hypothetical protein n=1 Tax=Sphingopyxis sp. TaxID=1908224 RepID=UPI001DED5244|nr:hypothetical protein [Sphingopyxis sp.]MBW8296184.1 hypothetical protein [Sphingopyxis sp.]
MIAVPQIEVRRDRKGFEVAVSSPSTRFDRPFPPSHHANHGAALYAARLFSEATGWRVIDRVDAGFGA